MLSNIIVGLFIEKYDADNSDPKMAGYIIAIAIGIPNLLCIPCFYMAGRSYSIARNKSILERIVEASKEDGE